MSQGSNSEEKSSLPPEELARRKHQIWLITGGMVLALCLITALLLGAFVIFGDVLRQFLASLT